MLDETVKVTFISPPSAFLLEDKVMPNLGVLYLTAWLRKHGHECSVIDLAGVEDWKLALTIETAKLDCDFLGISCTTPQYGISQTIAKNIRARGYNMPLVCGGIHITSLASVNRMDEFLRDSVFDAFCVGEGYNSVTKMADDLKSGAKLSRVYTEPILKDVNSLPFAARDLIDIKSYSYKLGDTPATTFYSQYGCMYQCSYCESPLSGSYTVRAMTPERIQAEIKDARDRFGIKGWMFFDDEMNLNKKRMLGICDKLRELGDIVWRGFMVTAKFDSELAEACKSSGCYEVASGIESGSPTILRNIRKPATRDINARFIRTAKKAGLRVKAFCIIGLPGESWETIRETDKFLEELKAEGCAPDDVDFSLLQIYPATPIAQNPMDVVFDSYADFDKMFYKSAPGMYESLVQVHTAKMSKEDLLCARNYMENKWKAKNWTKDHTDRKDLDMVFESIRTAEVKLRTAR